MSRLRELFGKQRAPARNYANGVCTVCFAEETRETAYAAPQEFQVSSPALLTVGESVAQIGEAQYATLEAAIAAAADGQTVTLLQDVALTSTITISKSLTLDLGGKSITGNQTEEPDTDRRWITVDAGTVTIQNGTFTGRVNAYDAGNLTLASGLTVNGMAVVWGDGVHGESGCKTPTLNVYGTISNTGDYAISTNGTDSSRPNINIYDGAAITSTDDIAIYLPSGTLTVSGGTITGATAVYVKSGTVSITGGTLYANGAATAYSHNGNSANPTGDAIVADNCNYPGGAPSVTIGSHTSVSGNFTLAPSSNGKAIAVVAATDNKLLYDPDSMTPGPCGIYVEAYPEIVTNNSTVISKGFIWIPTLADVTADCYTLSKISVDAT